MFLGSGRILFPHSGGVETTVGYANGHTQNPTYEEVCSGNTDHAETIYVCYDPDRVSLQTLTEQFFKIIDPLSINKQGNDVGRQYRTGIYYSEEADQAVLEAVMDNEQKKYSQAIAVELLPLVSYTLAEDDHQNYLKKNPGGYCHIDFSSLKDVMKESEPFIDPSHYSRPSDEHLKEMLSLSEYHVTQLAGTEPPFTGPYWDHKEAGLYVDIATGEPLFTSTDKFDSGCGWPSFTKPISLDVISKKEDSSHGMQRVEVRSRVGKSHLGHVFEDGPKDKGGLRYCINSAALRFIPYDDMEKEGFGALKKFVK